MRFIVSTVGTSILTNSINRENADEARDWGRILRKSANFKQDALSDETKTVIDTLAERSLEKLLKNDVNRTYAKLIIIEGFSISRRM